MEINLMGGSRLVDAAGELLLGASCPGCHRPGARVCPDCRRAAGLDPVLVTDAPLLGGLTGRTVSGGEYDGPLGQMVSAFKDRGAWQLAGLLSEVTARSLLVVPGLVDLVLSGCPVGLVPVPSSPSAVRRRGFDHTGRLAVATAARLASPELLGPSAEGAAPVEVVRALRRARGVRDQSGLGRDERVDNQNGSMRARWPGKGRCVVAVDDVCTTGASLAEAARALCEADWQVLGAVVVVHPSWVQ